MKRYAPGCSAAGGPWRGTGSIDRLQGGPQPRCDPAAVRRNCRAGCEDWSSGQGACMCARCRWVGVACWVVTALPVWVGNPARSAAYMGAAEAAPVRAGAIVWSGCSGRSTAQRAGAAREPPPAAISHRVAVQSSWQCRSQKRAATGACCSRSRPAGPRPPAGRDWGRAARIIPARTQSCSNGQ